MSKLQQNISKLKGELETAKNNLALAKTEVENLTGQLNGFNESVKTELNKKDKEILTWKIVSGFSISAVVVTAIGVTIASVKK